MKIYTDEEVIKWTSDQLQSEIFFRVRNPVISRVKGEFCQFEATILTNGRDFSTADVTLNIKSKSIYTGDSKRDINLRGPNFLCTDQYKQITFRSTGISQPDANGKMDLWGDLTVAGITGNVRLDMHMGTPSIDPWGDETASITITGKTAAFLTGNEIIISCKMELISLTQHDAKREQHPVALMRINS